MTGHSKRIGTETGKRPLFHYYFYFPQRKQPAAKPGRKKRKTAQQESKTPAAVFGSSTA